ncbi:hypothetical protein L1887_57725 [Cichorium endivia]|nr:hypothetical protein L1887_57725 [Cichorium endivia]
MASERAKGAIRFLLAAKVGAREKEKARGQICRPTLAYPQISSKVTSVLRGGQRSRMRLLGPCAATVNFLRLLHRATDIVIARAGGLERVLLAGACVRTRDLEDSKRRCEVMSCRDRRFDLGRCTSISARHLLDHAVQQRCIPVDLSWSNLKLLKLLSASA